MTEQDNVPELVDAVVIPDALRSAFAVALGAIMQAMPAGIARDIAVTEIMAAHERTERALARHRTLN